MNRRPAPPLNPARTRAHAAQRCGRMPRPRLPTLPLAALLGLASLCAGCQALAAPFLMWGAEPTRSVPAEYPYLAGKRVAAVVWVESETLFEFPNVQYELGEFVRDAITRNVKGVLLTPTRKVRDYQMREVNWDRVHPAELGKVLGADRVLVIELTQYTTREPDSPHLYRGRIHASVKVYDSSAPGSPPVYKTQIETAYPPDSPGQWGANDAAVRRGAMESFADELARRFYDHKVKIR